MRNIHQIATKIYGKIKPRGRKCAPDAFLPDKIPLDSFVANQILIEALRDDRAYCVGRLGGVEANVYLWSYRIKRMGRFRVKYPTFFWETANAATNAGLRPRTRDSYMDFAKLVDASLTRTDILGVWWKDYENDILARKSLALNITSGAAFSPTTAVFPHWMEGLSGKRLLVISPFEQTIQLQLPKMREVWAKRSLVWSSEVELARFPYLIDDNCQLDWRDVFDDFTGRIWRSNADVVLCGCGGLGLPLAAEAKKSGKVGLHLGGFLQLLFGIHGKRHIDQGWHANYFTSAWTNPIPEERAESANRVEGGCYW